MSERDTAYERLDTRVLDQLINASAHAGVNSSGLCISFGAGHNWLDVRYFRGALLARMRGQSPPFQPGQKLRVKPGHQYHWWNQPNPEQKELTVERVFFEDSGRWSLAFEEFYPFDDEGRLRDRYPADRFEPVPVEQ